MFLGETFNKSFLADHLNNTVNVSSSHIGILIHSNGNIVLVGQNGTGQSAVVDSNFQPIASFSANHHVYGGVVELSGGKVCTVSLNAFSVFDPNGANETGGAVSGGPLFATGNNSAVTLNVADDGEGAFEVKASIIPHDAIDASSITVLNLSTLPDVSSDFKFITFINDFLYIFLEGKYYKVDLTGTIVDTVAVGIIDAISEIHTIGDRVLASSSGKNYLFTPLENTKITEILHEGSQDVIVGKSRNTKLDTYGTYYLTYDNGTKYSVVNKNGQVISNGPIGNGSEYAIAYADINNDVIYTTMGWTNGDVKSYSYGMTYSGSETPAEPINFGQLVKLLANPNIPNEWTINPARTIVNSSNTYSFLKIGDLVYFKNTLGVEATRTILNITFGSTEIELDSPLPEGFGSNDFEVYGDPIEDAIKFLESIDMRGNKIINLAHGETIEDAVTVQQLNAAIFGVVSGLSSALTYKGDFDASVGTYTALEPASQGDYYIVSVTGTIGDITYNVGDHIVINKDVAGSVVVADIDLIKNTEFADTVYLDAVQTLINKTIDADNNIILNITLDQLKAGVLNTDLITLEALDTEIPSALAVQDLVTSDVTELETKISNLTFIYNVIGDDTTSDFVVNHSLACVYPIVKVINSTTKELVFVDIELTDANNITLRFDPTPAIGENYTVIVLGTVMAASGEGGGDSWFTFDGAGTITGLSAAWVAEVDNSKYDLVIPSTIGGVQVTTIGDGAFYEKLLTSVVIPDSVTTIELNAFYGNQLTNINIPSGVTAIDSYAFSNNQLTSVVAPNNVLTIGEGAFNQNALTNVTIENSATTLGDGAFYSTVGLTTIIVPAGMTFTYPYSFGDHGPAFVSTYDGDGKLAGTYTYDGGVWSKTA